MKEEKTEFDGISLYFHPNFMIVNWEVFLASHWLRLPLILKFHSNKYSLLILISKIIIEGKNEKSKEFAINFKML